MEKHYTNWDHLPSLFNRLCSSSGVVWDRPSFNLYKAFSTRTCCFVLVLSVSNLIFLWHFWQESQARRISLLHTMTGSVYWPITSWEFVYFHILCYIWQKTRLKKTEKWHLPKHLCLLFVVLFLGPIGCNMISGTLKDPQMTMWQWDTSRSQSQWLAFDWWILYIYFTTG